MTRVPLGTATVVPSMVRRTVSWVSGILFVVRETCNVKRREWRETVVRFVVDPLGRRDTLHEAHPCLVPTGSGRIKLAASAAWIKVTYSGRQCLSVLIIGDTSASPNAQTVRPAMFLHRSVKVSRSAI